MVDLVDKLFIGNIVFIINKKVILMIIYNISVNEHFNLVDTMQVVVNVVYLLVIVNIIVKSEESVNNVVEESFFVNEENNFLELIIVLNFEICYQKSSIYIVL